MITSTFYELDGFGFIFKNLQIIGLKFKQFYFTLIKLETTNIIGVNIILTLKFKKWTTELSINKKRASINKKENGKISFWFQ